MRLNFPLTILRGMMLSAAPESTVMPRIILILRPQTFLHSGPADLGLGCLDSAATVAMS